MGNLEDDQFLFLACSALRSLSAVPRHAAVICQGQQVAVPRKWKLRSPAALAKWIRKQNEDVQRKQNEEVQRKQTEDVQRATASGTDKKATTSGGNNNPNVTNDNEEHFPTDPLSLLNLFNRRECYSEFADQVKQTAAPDVVRPLALLLALRDLHSKSSIAALCDGILGSAFDAPCGGCHQDNNNQKDHTAATKPLQPLLLHPEDLLKEGQRGNEGDPVAREYCQWRSKLLQLAPHYRETPPPAPKVTSRGATCKDRLVQEMSGTAIAALLPPFLLFLIASYATTGNKAGEGSESPTSSRRSRKPTSDNVWTMNADGSASQDGVYAGDKKMCRGPGCHKMGATMRVCSRCVPTFKQDKTRNSRSDVTVCVCVCFGPKVPGNDVLLCRVPGGTLEGGTQKALPQVVQWWW